MFQVLADPFKSNIFLKNKQDKRREIKKNILLIWHVSHINFFTGETIHSN